MGKVSVEGTSTRHSLHSTWGSSTTGAKPPDETFNEYRLPELAARDSKLEHLEQSLLVLPRRDPGDTLSLLMGCRASVAMGGDRRLPPPEEVAERRTAPRPVNARTVSHFRIPLARLVVDEVMWLLLGDWTLPEGSEDSRARLQLSRRTRGDDVPDGEVVSRRRLTRFLIPGILLKMLVGWLDFLAGR